MQNFFNDYINTLFLALKNVDYKILESISSQIEKVKYTNKKIFFIGNGGSASTSSHSAGDWSKELGIKAHCLTDNIASLTAFSNDINYEMIFENQLKIYMDDGDLIMAYSGSGNSNNVINAIKYAKSKGNYTIGFTGNYRNLGGGVLAKITDRSIVVDTNSMEQIEDSHLIINHFIKEFLKQKLMN